MKASNILMWIVLGLAIFSIGYVGASLYRQHQVDIIHNQPAPALPNSQK